MSMACGGGWSPGGWRCGAAVKRGGAAERWASGAGRRVQIANLKLQIGEGGNRKKTAEDAEDADGFNAEGQRRRDTERTRRQWDGAAAGSVTATIRNCFADEECASKKQSAHGGHN